jgi:hypothetical protein
MPALPNVNKVVRVTVQHVYANDLDVISRFFVHYSGSTPDETDILTLADNVIAAWSANLITLCSTSVALATVECVDLSSDTGAGAEAADAVEGTRSGDFLSANDCAVVGYGIRRRYRGGHPRGYWPFGVEQDLVSPQAWKVDFLADVSEGIGGFFTDVVAGGWGAAGTLLHKNVSYYRDFNVVIDPQTGRARNVPTPRGSAVTDDVVTYLPRARVGSQRRRLLK